MGGVMSGTSIGISGIVMVCNSELVYVKCTLGTSLMTRSCSCLALYKAIL